MALPGPVGLFGDLMKRVENLRAIGEVAGINDDDSESIFRACIVLSVAALDTYMHEKASEIFLTSATASTSIMQSVSSFLNLTSARIAAPDAPSAVRYHLSFKTLATPNAIDRCMTAAGSAADEIWKKIAMDAGTRENRIRTSLELFVDRRNQIAHEGDWDPSLLDYRHISVTHALDCRRIVETVVQGVDKHWI
ncbi:HEPN domain-containing protein [Amycolatopsis sp. cmx-11-32]|uniref:HEPN domain-containing protein n=1 Tax=Amycolatopsis sp. cmx-11-32 TaxID=2785796 RepID=UPI0039E25E27